MPFREIANTATHPTASRQPKVGGTEALGQPTHSRRRQWGGVGSTDLLDTKLRAAAQATQKQTSTQPKRWGISKTGRHYSHIAKPS